MAAKSTFFSKFSKVICVTRKCSSPKLNKTNLNDVKTPSPSIPRKMSPLTPSRTNLSTRTSFRHRNIKSSPLILLNLAESVLQNATSPLFDSKTNFTKPSEFKNWKNLEEDSIIESSESDGEINESLENTHEISEEEFELDTPTRIRVLDQGLEAISKKALVIGQGGFGTVVKAVHKGHDIAAKIINKSRRRRISIDYCVSGEMNALTLNHPNIVHTLGVFGLQDKNALILMEFVGLKNLQTVLDDSNEHFNWERRLRYALEIVDALRYCHSRNIVHLDLKPANVIISNYDTCKLGDFGCSRFLTGLTENYNSTFPIDGTVAYKAPELLRGKLPTLKADIYSFGIVLWQLLTREIPYRNTNPHVIIYKVVAFDFRPTLNVNFQLDVTSGKYINLFTLCWSRDQDIRPDCSVVNVSLENIQVQL